jgi:hypothetical protein
MNRGEFTRAVLLKLNAPIDGGRLALGVAWAAFEGSDAKNNPWDTTLNTAGSTDYNSEGVKNYRTFDEGVDATVQTLLEVDYATLVRNLRNPGCPIRTIRASLNASPWGSTISEILYADVVKRYSTYNTEVAGSGSDSPVPGTTAHVVPKVVTQSIKENVSMSNIQSTDPVAVAQAALYAALTATPYDATVVATAQANLASALTSTSVDPTISAAREALAAAVATGDPTAIANAQANLNSVFANEPAGTIQDAFSEMGVDRLEDRIAAAEAASGVTPTPPVLSVADATAAVTAAQAQLATDTAAVPQVPATIATDQSQLITAQANLATAVAAAGTTPTGSGSPITVASAQSAVTNAQSALASAVSALATVASFLAQ